MVAVHHLTFSYGEIGRNLIQEPSRVVIAKELSRDGIVAKFHVTTVYIALVLEGLVGRSTFHVIAKKHVWFYIFFLVYTDSPTHDEASTLDNTAAIASVSTDAKLKVLCAHTFAGLGTVAAKLLILISVQNSCRRMWPAPS